MTNPLIKTLQEGDELFDIEFRNDRSGLNSVGVQYIDAPDTKFKSFNHSRSLKLLESLRNYISSRKDREFEGNYQKEIGWDSALDEISSLLDEAINLYRK